MGVTSERLHEQSHDVNLQKSNCVCKASSKKNVDSIVSFDSF